MFLLIGLGNPEEKYAHTRHNYGFQVVDAIWRRYAFTAEQKKFSGLIAGGEILTAKVLLFKPTTYMNDSGIAVAQVKKFYQVPLENIIVFQDEADLPLGHIKVKTGGSSAGHNGIKSIDQNIGVNYTRVRLGIKPLVLPVPDFNCKTPEFVLGRFTTAEQKLVTVTIDNVVDAVPLLLSQEYVTFAHRVNSTA